MSTCGKYRAPGLSIQGLTLTVCRGKFGVLMTNHNIFRASDWVAVPDVAKRAGVSRQAIHQAISTGRLRSIQFGKRSTLVLKADVERYMESRNRKVG